MLIKTETGTQDVPLLNAYTGEFNVNADNYIVPAGEEKLYHVIQELRKFNPETGKRLSRPAVQKYGKKEYDTIVQRQLRLQGYTVVVLHEPTIDEVKQPVQVAKPEEDAEVNTLRGELAALKAAKKRPAKKSGNAKADAPKDEEKN